MTRNKFALFAILFFSTFIVCCLLFALFIMQNNATAYSSMLKASRDIQIGMTLEQAEPLLQDSTLVLECGSTYLYFFGGQNLGQAKVLALSTDKQNGESVISQVTAPEANMVKEYMDFGNCKEIK